MAHSEKNPSQSIQSNDQASNSGTSGVRHVGKTLESDPEYNDMPSRAMAPEAGLIDRSGNDLTANPNIRAGSDQLAGTEIARAGTSEPLKTRLPGDTSSDPHTDLGPDNATTVQHRGEGKKSH